jgi:hypothetical protein
MIKKITLKVIIKLYDVLDDLDNFIQSYEYKFKGARIVPKVFYEIGNLIRGIMFNLDSFLYGKYGDDFWEDYGYDMYEKSVENLSAQRIIHNAPEN